MSLATRPIAAPSASRLWIPRQHGAWPMLAVPLLLGVAVGGANPWQLVLAAAAAAGYLAVVSGQTWLRARSRDRYRLSVLVFGTTAAAFGVVLVVSHPALVLCAVVVVPAAALTLATSRSGRPRTLLEGFAEVAQALVLVPAAAYLAAPSAGDAVVRATLAAGIYLTGTVFAVRSVIRERDNTAFAVVSAGYHTAGTVVAAVVLPFAYAVLFAALTFLAALLPVIRRRRASTDRPLRPIHVGMLQMAASLLLVVLSFAIGF